MEPDAGPVELIGLDGAVVPAANQPVVPVGPGVRIRQVLLLPLLLLVRVGGRGVGGRRCGVRLLHAVPIHPRRLEQRDVERSGPHRAGAAVVVVVGPRGQLGGHPARVG